MGVASTSQVAYSRGIIPPIPPLHRSGGAIGFNTSV